MLDSTRKHIVMPVLEERTSRCLSVDGLLGRLHQVVKSARNTHPELADFHLHDVSLRVEDGELRAILDFRK